MIGHLAVWLALAAPPTAASPAPAPPAATAVVPFSSPESIGRLEHSGAKVDFFALITQYEGQEHGGMCGPASATIVLNALRINNAAAELPRDAAPFPAQYVERLPKGFDPVFRRYTQSAVVADARFQKVKSTDVFYGAPPAAGQKPDPGMQLRQLGDVLVGFGLDVKVHVLDDTLSDADAKKIIVENLTTAGDFVIVNYTRASLGQKGGGHLSPLGAYDTASDSFLVLDTNPSEGKGIAWVPARQLLLAMRTKDTLENRGFLLVKEKAAPARGGAK